MDKELFKKTEGILYRYYESNQIIARMKSKVKFIDQKLEEIKNEIKNLNNFEADVYSNMGIDYSRDAVQTSASSSNEVERAMIKYIDNLENLYKAHLDEKLKLNDEVTKIELLNHDIEFNINTLNDEAKRFIELKYKEKLSMKYISTELFGGVESTAFRKRQEFVSNIAHWINITLKI